MHFLCNLWREENDLTSSSVVETVAQWGIDWSLQEKKIELWFVPTHPPTITHQDQTDTARVGEESQLPGRGGRTWGT